MLLALLALAWSKGHGDKPTRAERGLEWIGATDQGRQVRAVTVHGVVTSLTTRVTTHCTNGSTWTLRLTMPADSFGQTGEVVHGRQGPTASVSDQREPVVVATRLHGVMGERPTGTIASEVTRRPGPKALYCNSYNVAYVLHRPTTH